MDTAFITSELARIKPLYRKIYRALRGELSGEDTRRLREIVRESASAGLYIPDKFGINPLIHALETSTALCELVSPDRNMSIAVMLHAVSDPDRDMDVIAREWGDDIAKMVRGLDNVRDLYTRHAAVQDANFSHLLMTFADDIRVIIIMLVDRLMLMRAINHHPDQENVMKVAAEAGYLYAPLAHRLGLYAIKSELEDLSLKYTNRETYTAIARKLNQTKVRREAYIADFIAPVKARLQAAGLKFDIKGRTKSISSILNKIKKQRVDLDHIYDLFAIRVILDTEPENEKRDCWMVYSIITDMFQPNPSRMKDWISVPKSNGYESLHITVAGPEGRWVEVQIRTRRMDLVAEKGLAAHWRYKGIKSEGSLDRWMNNVRDILETDKEGPMALMRNFKMDLYDQEVFVFTPKGDLVRLPKGATLLDFAFNIHSKIGCICTGGRVNGKHRRIDYKLRSGDTVEVITSAQQRPKLDWLNIAVTGKARSKIRQSVAEQNNASAELAREMLTRRFKNRKIEFDEAVMARTVKKLGYRAVTDFYNDIASEAIDVNDAIEKYLEIGHAAAEPTIPVRSAEEFTLQQADDEGRAARPSDVLVIGQGDVKSLNYRMARCCNPIYGDDVFGFVSSEGVVKIHRTDCPNAANIRQRYPYRIITTRWSGRMGDMSVATLRVLGIDDIGIVTNITSMINKEKGVILRSISIDSNDGLFQGHLTVGVNDTQTLNSMIKKLKTLKGVKDVTRSN